MVLEMEGVRDAEEPEAAEAIVLSDDWFDIGIGGADWSYQVFENTCNERRWEMPISIKHVPANWPQNYITSDPYLSNRKQSCHPNPVVGPSSTQKSISSETIQSIHPDWWNSPVP
jgi:hypothetical protein